MEIYIVRVDLYSYGTSDYRPTYVFTDYKKALACFKKEMAYAKAYAKENNLRGEYKEDKYEIFDYCYEAISDDEEEKYIVETMLGKTDPNV